MGRRPWKGEWKEREAAKQTLISVLPLLHPCPAGHVFKHTGRTFPVEELVRWAQRLWQRQRVGVHLCGVHAKQNKRWGMKALLWAPQRTKSQSQNITSSQSIEGIIYNVVGRKPVKQGKSNNGNWLRKLVPRCKVKGRECIIRKGICKRMQLLGSSKDAEGWISRHSKGFL